MERFFAAIQTRDHAAIAACYCEDATFEDIAFRLEGRRSIHTMWRMIAGSDMRVDYNIVSAAERQGEARWTADYTFRKNPDAKGRPIQNKVRSTFTFRDGLIARQVDHCDALRWALQAMGPLLGVLSWMFPSVRRRVARQRLENSPRKRRSILEVRACRLRRLNQAEKCWLLRLNRPGFVGNCNQSAGTGR
ncbi:nuclear transport factor 2 family protein [Falsiroseomonas sp. E2-1-a4]|uniref:nuclear transport factor 2 family protein n=1 Tax=Falsiroseomonas sp. E2-1-a4 TaxID=3239299 RepID=UPI003F3BAFA0